MKIIFWLFINIFLFEFVCISQTFNNVFIYNGMNTAYGQICLKNNNAHLFYGFVDTSSPVFGAYGSLHAKLSSNGIINVNYAQRPGIFYGFITPNYYCKTHAVPDGFISSGFTRDTFNNGYAILNVYDTNGVSLFYKRYTHYESGSFDVLKCKNKNEYLITGRSIEAGTGVPIYIRADSLGNEMYYKYYDHPEFRYYDNNVIARSIIELDSGNALLVCDGVNNNLPTPLWRYATPVITILIKVDSVGNELWRWLDPSNDSRCAYSFQKTSDGGYVSCGFNFGFRDTMNQNKSYQPCIIKWRSDLSIEWKKWYDEYRKDSIGGELYDVKELSDGSFIACGYGGETVIDNFFMGGIILKVDRHGNLLWRKYYSAFPDSSHNRNIQNYLYDIDVFENGDIIAVGETRPTWGIGQRAWILRTDSTGCIVDSNWCGWNSIEVENPYAQSNQAASIQIYPNPASEYIHIAFTNSVLHSEDKIYISIIDIQGRRVVNKSETYSENIILDISTLDKGIYFVKIQSTNNNVITNAKWVKE